MSKSGNNTHTIFKINIMEEWKVIPEFDKYEASNLGNIRTLKTGKIRKLQSRKDGYLQIGLYIHGKVKFQQVHRLIALAFIPKTGIIINHIDGNKSNNTVSNLEWCDYSYNLKHAVKIGTRVKHNLENHPSTNLKNKDVLNMRKDYEKGLSYKDISKKYNKPYSTIYNIINKLYWKDI